MSTIDANSGGNYKAEGGVVVRAKLTYTLETLDAQKQEDEQMDASGGNSLLESLSRNLMPASVSGLGLGRMIGANILHRRRTASIAGQLM